MVPSDKVVPPAKLDGADVLEWAWSGAVPFGYVLGGEAPEVIHGLAIARYSGSDTVYRFSCDAQWEVVQDSEYSSVLKAKERLPDQYKQVPAVWRTFER